MIAFTDQQLMGWLSAFLYPFFRVLGLMSSAPILSHRSVPVRVRVLLSAAITMAAAPMIQIAPGVALDSPTGFLRIPVEVGIGITIGYVARLVFASFEIAGEAIGLQMGLSYAGFFDPAFGSANAIGRIVGTLSFLTFVTLNGHLMLIGAVVHSFTLFPVSPDVLSLPWSGMQVTTLGREVFQLALSIALPFFALMLFVNIVLGFVSRVAPQFNAFAVGFPIMILAGVGLFALGLPLLEEPLMGATERALSALMR
jgi:flagellar biosynthetic protein FliR